MLLLRLLLRSECPGKLSALLGVGCSLRNQRVFRGIGSVREDRIQETRWFATVQKKEWGEACSGLLSGVVGVRYKWEDLVPILVVRRNIHGQHITQGTVEALRKTVGLWVVGCSSPVDNAACREEGLNNLGEKNTASVAEQLTGSTMTEHETM